ncbi:hypothetical protein [Oceaniglobus trochenteri]|uniref:hypothetical protein n=1 Tax=Oceaniglobus trochenteri TaxID=2763260 RepID=UPI001CFF6C6C|nr:hypothetical protein [Oceaniglobus trochenteri]
MIPVWPSDLPHPARGTWQAQVIDTRVRRTAGGVPGYRRRFSARTRAVSLSILVPRSGKAVFDRFFEMVGDGTLPFWMPDPTTDGWPLLSDAGTPLLTADGTPLLLGARWLCLFGEEPPVETIRGTQFELAFGVTVLP